MDICFYCENFDPDDTGLPVCVLTRRHVEANWTCDGYEGRDRGEEEEAEDQRR